MGKLSLFSEHVAHAKGMESVLRRLSSSAARLPTVRDACDQVLSKQSV